MAVNLASQERKTAAPHPLEPLSPDEIAAAVAIVRTSGKLGPNARFVTVSLHEPPKQAVLDYRDGDPVEREVFVIILDNADGATYEAVASITEGTIKSWTHIPHVQPSIMLDEFFECETTLKHDPGFQDALRKRGITDFSLLMVDPWSAWYYGQAEERTLRLARALTWVRADPNDNGYAHPVEGLLAGVLIDEGEG